jgi:hypothetical protein
VNRNHAHWEPKPPERGVDRWINAKTTAFMADVPWQRRRESRRHLLLAAIVLVFTCAAIYALIVGLGS